MYVYYVHVYVYICTHSIASFYNVCMLLLYVGFPHRNEYLCFQKITKLEYSIPDGFPDNAKDVVTKLLVSMCTNPSPFTLYSVCQQQLLH